MRNSGVATLVAIACALTACSGGNSVPASAGAGTSFVQSLGPDAVMHFALPANTIGEELPGEGVGQKNDPTWGEVGGFTQSTTAQVLAFPPNTQVTIDNLSSSISHTLDVVKKVAKPPAKFPQNPKLPTMPAGGGILQKGYASGTIKPKGSVTVMLSKKGTYLIGCAFHYHEGMQDVIRVAAKATPGPTFKQ